ncbi:MAG TPA: DPP IV N-terminal domain-containing protein [Blastocatellia bacterium]|nr:DPP IV N-terminal domain-containing protein [Blastocatellia bacterium]
MKNKEVKVRYVLIISLIVATVSLFTAHAQQTSSGQQNPQSSDQSLRQQIGTIIVTPGNGPALAVADFQPRASGIEKPIDIFNSTLWNDLKFAGAATLVGKSLYPKALLADPASLKSDQWSQDPVKADYVAFGNLTGASDAQGFLYDVKTQHQLLASPLEGDPRHMAHVFADQIVKQLLGIDGIATSKIAYIRGQQVYLMDYDGYDERAFSHEGGITLFPALSPDGGKLAYVTYSTGQPNIVVRGIDGLVLGSTHFNATTSSPAFSPNGQLAFSSSKDGDSMEIYVSAGDGSGARRLTHTRNAVNISPRWNPKTGQEIAFISDRGGTPQIYVMDASGGNERRLLSGGGHMDSPSWSPDGRFIAFTWDGGGGGYNIYLADVATGQVLQLTSQGRNESPTWSPDGRHIAFQSNRSGKWEIWAMHIDGSEQQQLTHSGGRLPSWSK